MYRTCNLCFQEAKHVYVINVKLTLGYIIVLWACCHLLKLFNSFIHSLIYSHSIDHTDVEFVVKYKYKQATIYKYKLRKKEIYDIINKLLTV